jgi:hypothetical protein
MPRGYPTSPETVAEARRLYEGTDLSEPRIAAIAGLSRPTLRRFAAIENWSRPEGPDRSSRRQDVVASLRERIESEIVAAEAALGGPATKKTDGVERISRSLASLVRTLRELAKYDEERAARAGRERGDASQGEGADGDLADLDAFREALAERLERMRAERGA